MAKFPDMRLILILLTLLFLASGCQNKELPSKYLSSLSVVRETEQKQDHSSQAYTPQETSPSQVPVSQISSVRYHIIVASFSASEKLPAEKLVAQLKAKHYPATLITSSQRYRVSIENFSTEQEANNARDKYRSIIDRQDIWIYKAE